MAAFPLRSMRRRRAGLIQAIGYLNACLRREQGCHDAHKGQTHQVSVQEIPDWITELQTILDAWPESEAPIEVKRADDQLLPQTWVANLSYWDSDGNLHSIATDRCLAFNREEAAAILLERHWDARLDSAGCRPSFDWRAVELQHFVFTPPDGEADIPIKTVTREEALQVIQHRFPNAVLADVKDDKSNE